MARKNKSAGNTRKDSSKKRKYSYSKSKRITSFYTGM
jgi:hypothetical protein